MSEDQGVGQPAQRHAGRPLAEHIVPDDQHRRPPGCADVTVEAVGKASEAFEFVKRMKGTRPSVR